MNRTLESTPLRFPLDYSRYFWLYVVVSQETVGMVLVQEDDEFHEHVIYCISWNTINVELRYTHVEKLALATTHRVQ